MGYIIHVHIHVYTDLIRMTYCTYRKYYNGSNVHITCTYTCIHGSNKDLTEHTTESIITVCNKILHVHIHVYRRF